MRILVVDDDEPGLQTLVDIVKAKFVCRTIEARNGLEALTMIDREEPDLVFLDVCMPIMDGIETLEAIRSDPAHADLPVVVITGLSDRETISKMLQLGVMDYLLKPLWPDKVYQRISQVIPRIKERRASQLKRRVEGGGSDGRQKILIADKDLNFRSFFVVAGR